MPTQKRLRIGIARDNFIDLPKWSTGYQEDEASYYTAVAEAGYEAVQGGEPGPCAAVGLQLFGNGVVHAATDAAPFADHWKSRGAVAATCIAGFGYESNEEVDAIAQAILFASKRTGLPIYIETHRASITQDVWRCLRLVERNPEVRFNGDISHWYTGLEMPANSFDVHIQQLAPVFAKTRFLHGRIGNACCMQVDIGTGDEALIAPFRRMWTAVMVSFAKESDGLDDLWFFPEILGTPHEYARVFGGREESDRWQQASVLTGIAVQCARDAGLAVSFSAK